MRTPSFGHAVAAAAVAIVALSPVPPIAQEKPAGPGKAVAGKSAPAGKAARAALTELWVQPRNIAERDLFLGPGGARDVPSQDGVYTVIGRDVSGNSFGYDVTDDQGRTWDLKVGIEAQPELVASRVLWAIGYHQPVMHFLSTWKKKGDEAMPQSSARFRLQSDHKSDGDWSWQDNPFTGTRQMKGLLVANLVLNNWDLKDTQNRIYTSGDRTAQPARRFVVQDLGAALGRTGWPVGNRNDIDDFESQNLIASVKDGVITFDYHARHRELFEDITPDDVAWVCGLLSRITDKQWADAFRAATYPPEIAARYIAKLKAKIAEGRAVASRHEARP
jgi:hypothetical protein